MSKILANMRLRTKLLFSLVLVTAGLTCATLLVVWHTARVQVQREMEDEARNAILAFQVVQQQHQIELSHKADLLATLAVMRNGDATTIQDVSEDPWQSENCDLFVLVDPGGKIVAMHTTAGVFPIANAEEMFRRSITSDTTGWWYSGTRLYQVVLQRFYADPPLNKTLLGTVIVGRGIDNREVSDLRRISASQVVLRYGGTIVVSTLNALKEWELTPQIQGRSAPEQVQIDNERYLASTVELTLGTRPAVSLTVLKSYNDATAVLKSLYHLLLGIGLVAVLAGGALVFVISDTFTHPLARLVGGVRALEQGNFTYPLETHGGDEVAQVTRAFDGMRATLQRNEVHRQQLEDQLRQSQKMDAIGRLAGGVAHDFNNLLTVIMGHSGLLLQRLKPTDSPYASIEQIEKAANRAASLTRQLLAFCRMQVLQPKILDLNALVSDMGKMVERLVREDVKFDFQPGESLGHVKADPGQIEQVILNLIVNASDAMPGGGSLTIETRNVAPDEKWTQTRPSMKVGRYVMLAVTDSGCGMDAATKSRIFEPFFTTKGQGKGTGLGLATVYGVVKQSGGWIWVDSEQGNGTRFEIYFPRVDEVEETTLQKKIAADTAQRAETVLIAEDEEAVRELASQFLKSAGYRVLTANDGMEALAIAERSGEPIHVLITDIVMPNMRGPELAKRLKPLHANLKVVYMSGYLEYEKGSEEFLEGGFFLQKPFSRDTLVRKVGEALKNESAEESSALPSLQVT
jgi:signal transduction histidine kinase/ActR/RegA family two-component response regulator